MLVNLFIMIIIALIFAMVFERMKLPPLLGMIAAGILLGPYSREFFLSRGTDSLSWIFISEDVLTLSGELRTGALIVILIRAGLGINKSVLNKIGVTAIKMAAIPCLIEGLFITLLGHYFIGLSLPVAGTLAFVIAAVSPAVIVPEMLSLREGGYGRKKEIPTLILAGASIDDVFAITLFGSFLSMALGGKVRPLRQLMDIPISILIGIAGGGLIGFILLRLFTRFHMRDTRKVLIFMAAAIFYHHLEELKIIPLASLLGIMTMGFIILERNEVLAHRMAAKFNKVWVLAELLLFVLIGAAVNLSVVGSSGITGIIIIGIGLLGRWLGVTISLAGSELSKKERLFCKIAYSPKATVQAAIGGIPLAMGLPEGEMILAVAVLSIVITAPLGAIGIRGLKDSLLEID